MKIAYVTIRFPVPSEAFAAVEMRALRRQGADLHVLCYRGPIKGAAAMLEDRGLADLPIDHGSVTDTLRGMLLSVLRPSDAALLLGSIFRQCRKQPRQIIRALLLVPRSLILLERVEALKPDVVHLYWGHLPSLLGFVVQRRLPDVLVSQFLGAYDLEEAFPLSGIVGRDADYVVTLSRANVEAVAALGVSASKVQVSFHGVDIPEPLPDPRKIRGLMVIAERLVPQKHTDDAIRVFAELRRKLLGVRLVVCGTGPELPRLKQLSRQLGLSNSVHFAGHLQHTEVLEQIGRAEVTLTMSRSPSERLPNVIKEAMLRRCLCLSSRTAGIEELIDDGETGLVVDPGDIEGAANRLREVLADQDTVIEFGRRAQVKIATEFNVDNLMADRLRIWSSLRDGRHRGTAAWQ